MIPKPTEDTITGFLVKELERRGVKAQTFPTISTPRGVRKPDIWCVNGGTYPIEAKFKEGDLIDAISKVQNDYLRWHDILGITGGFALLYPEELSKPLTTEIVEDLAGKLSFKAIAMFPPKDRRKNFTVYDGTLREIGKILADHILAPPEYVEPRTDYIIKTLQTAAEHITLTLKYLSGKELEDLFGGKDVFENILQYEERKYPLEALRLASAYLLINQLLFYHVLSRRMPEKFPEIDADQINKPSDLNEYFQRVFDVNYRTVFSYNVASLIMPGFTKQVKAVVNVVKGLSPEKVGGDFLGTIFHDLVPFEVRKNVAAFYTNVLAAEILSSLSIDKNDAKVADLAVGSGGLLVAAYRRKRTLLETELKRAFTEADHRRYLARELLGVDVMPFAANVAACHLALQSPEYFSDKVNVAIWDSTDLLPSQTIPSLAGLKFVLKGQTGLEAFIKSGKKKKGVVSLTGKLPEEITLDTYDTIIMNPPFTRQERIPKEYKNTLIERFKDCKAYLHGQMGYYGYFILLADRFLKDNGRMALVLPATALHVRSARGIRNLWSKSYHIEYIVTSWQRLAFSESVAFREILLVAKKVKPTSNAQTKICVLKKLPAKISEAREIAGIVKRADRDCKADAVAIKIHPYSKLTHDTTDWHRFISLSDLGLVDFLDNVLSSAKMIALSSLTKARECDLRHYKFKGFHGFVLSDSERMKRKNDQWFLDTIDDKLLTARHRKLRHTLKIPLGCLKKALRRFSYIDTIDISENSDYLILRWFDKIKEMARYLLSSKELNALNPKIIDSWKRKFERKNAHLLLARRLYLSSPGTCLISFYAKSPTLGIDLWSLRDIDQKEAKMLSLWLNSSLNILQLLYMGVACEGPWMKLHNYMFDRLLVPNPRKLTKEEWKKLLKLFEETKSVSLPSISEQLSKRIRVRKMIDKAFLGILGFRDTTDNFINNLYASILNEIEAINRLMHA